MKTKHSHPTSEQGRPGSRPIIDEHDHAAATQPAHEEVKERRPTRPKKRPRRI